jgi:lysophospholipase L1-like esterase
MSNLLVLAVVAGALCGVALVAELCARWWVRHRGGYYVFPPGWRLRLQPDRETFPGLERETRFDINSDGERGDEVPRGPGVYRVLVIGGSQPEGYLLDQHTNWPGALQQLLQKPKPLARLASRHVHVGSIARSGTGSEGLALILPRVLPRYPRLQMIVILVGASDMLRWLEEGAPPSPPTAFETADVFRCHPELAFGWTPGRLALLELSRRLRHRWLRPVERHDRAGSWVGRARAMRASARIVRTSTPDPEPMLDHFDHHFKKVLEAARAHAERVLVVRQPWFDRPCTREEAALMWHGGAGRAWREEVTDFYSHEVLSTLMGLLDARAARLARQLEVEQLDVRPFLEPGVETYYDFFHATPVGARIVATAVAATILRQPLALPRRSDAPRAPAAADVESPACADLRAS